MIHSTNGLAAPFLTKLRFENHIKIHFALFQIGMKIGLDSKTGLAAPFLTKLRFENHKKTHFARLQKRSEPKYHLATEGLAAPFLQSSALKTTKKYTSLDSKKEASPNITWQPKDWLRPSCKAPL